MKKWLLLLGLIFCAAHARASVCTTLSGAVSQSTFQSAAASCGSGNTIALAASTAVNLTSAITNWPCGVSIAGPTITSPTLVDPGDGHPRYIYIPTALIHGTIPGRQQALQAVSCTTPVRYSYIEWDGEQPSSLGGSFMYLPGNQQNVTFDHVYLHGNQTAGASGSMSQGDTMIYLDGTNPGTNTQNISIHDSFFGATGDCSNIMQNVNGGTGYQGGAMDSTGGACSPLGIHTGITNLAFYNNGVYFQEQGIKHYEGTGSNQTSYCDSCSFYNNDFSNTHRIGFETQVNPALNGGTNEEVYYNSYHDNYFGGFGTWGFSLANNVLTETDAHDNVVIANNPPVNPPPSGSGYMAGAFETWGSASTVENNLIQGYWASADQFNYLGNFTITGNKICGQGTPVNGMTYMNNAQSPVDNHPTLSGNSPSGANSENVTGSTSCSPVTSATPSISPAPGAQTFPLTVTVTNSGVNTGSWYTIDGSTPVPGSGTAQYIAAGGTFLLPAAATVKAVGMWGAYNQPATYPSGYGYVPSGAVSATYTGSSSGSFISPTGNDSNSGSMSSPWLTPNHTMTGGQVITALAGTYSAANFQNGKWGTVTPSGSNDIAWVTCATFDACKISSTTGDAVYIDKDYWGITGFEATTNSASSNEAACFRATPSGAYILHHVVFANDIANGCKGGGFMAYETSTASSVDYIALVGDIAYNAAQGAGECFSGLSIYEPINFDTGSGTHIYAAGNFSYANVDPNPCAGSTPTDGEAVIFDTFDGRQTGTPVYTGQAVMQNNIGFFNGGRGFEVLNNSMGSSHANIYVKGNTSFGNSTDNNQTGGCFDRGELYAQNVDSITWLYNLAQTRTGTSCSSAPLYGFGVLSGDSSSNIGNSWWAGTGGNDTDPNTAGVILGTGNQVGTNPSFANPVNPGAPSCGGFASTVDCMATVISDYVGALTGPSTYGYQTPSNTSITDPLFPAWLCNGGSLIAGFPSGLVTPGCGGASPIPASGYLGNPGSVNRISVGAGTIPFAAWVSYTVGSDNNALPDGFGNTVMNWSIVPGSSTCGTINSTGEIGTFTPTTPGTCNVKVTCSCTTATTFSQWTMTVISAVPGTAPPPVSVIVISEKRGPQ